MSSLFRLSLGLILLFPAVVAAAVLENPGSDLFYSGIGAISGWKCERSGPLTVRFNGGIPIPLAYFNERPDTAERCGDTNNGFVAIWNWALLGDGSHVAIAYDSGVEFARSTFEVVSSGEDFIRGASGECTIQDFPSPGENTTFEWNQNTQHLEMVEVESHIPGPPENLAAEPGNRRLTITWDPPADDDGFPIIHYGLRYKRDGATTAGNDYIYKYLPADTREYRITGLTNGQGYTIHVWAVNDRGDGLKNHVVIRGATPRR